VLLLRQNGKACGYRQYKTLIKKPCCADIKCRRMKIIFHRHIMAVKSKEGKMRTACKVVKALMFGTLLTVMGIIAYYSLKLPDSYSVTRNSTLVLSDNISVTSRTIKSDVYSDARQAAIFGTGTHSEQLMLWGIFPIKRVEVTETDAHLVIPCGTPFGIKMTTEGVIVIELSGFDNGTEIVSPAKDAGITEGDFIISISGQEVHSNREVSDIISASGGDILAVEIVRDSESQVVYVQPQKSAADDAYHAGMWVCDSSAGIGTVTFYDPSTKTFAGLGHPVCDNDTGEILTMSEGSTAAVYITGIKKSIGGNPGELSGAFISEKDTGILKVNCEAGVYGTMDEQPIANESIEVAMRQEIVTGKSGNIRND